MKYLRFPPLERDLSRLILGTAMFDAVEPEVAEALLHAWLALGGNGIDTAHAYGHGHSERVLGRWLQVRGSRGDVVLITKGAHYSVEGANRVTPEDITCDLRDSLSRLQTDAIDIYLLHRDDPGKPVGPIIEALDELQRAGRIRSSGASNWSTQRLEEANAYATAHGLAGFACSSPNLSLARQKEPPWRGTISASDPVSRAWYQRTQLPVLAWSSQAGGFFTERHTPQCVTDREVERVYSTPENWERRRRAQELGEQKGYTANQIALAWVLHQPFPTYAIIGPHSVEELRSSVVALEVELTPKETRWLDLEA